MPAHPPSPYGRDEDRGTKIQAVETEEAQGEKIRAPEGGKYGGGQAVVVQQGYAHSPSPAHNAPYPDADAASSEKSEGGARARPMPLSAILKTEEEHVRRGQFQSVGQNRTEVEYGPPCWMCPFFMPFPFFCLGCCLTQTTKAVFDDTASTITLTTYCGKCCCCAETRIIPYDTVGNVALGATNVRINRLSAYEIVLVLRDGEKVCLGTAAPMHDIQWDFWEWHKFLFGRNDSEYVRPEPYLMIAD
eukprot:Hpha_TRINITY_DN26833_c0_g1::TRINITY_DN26833_c0_g1_i1::g.17276::m.17276